MAARASALVLNALLVRGATTVESPAQLPLLPLDDSAFQLAPAGRPLAERSASVEWALPSFTKSADCACCRSCCSRASPSLAEQIVAALPQDVNTDPLPPSSAGFWWAARLV